MLPAFKMDITLRPAIAVAHLGSMIHQKQNQLFQIIRSHVVLTYTFLNKVSWAQYDPLTNGCSGAFLPGTKE